MKIEGKTENRFAWGGHFCQRSIYPLVHRRCFDSFSSEPASIMLVTCVRFAQDLFDCCLHFFAPGSRRPLVDCWAPLFDSLVLDKIAVDTLKPAPGSRHRHKRKGRGIAAGQGASCGFGMRGQKSRSGPGVRAGFEGGQTPLYRRLPKLVGRPMGPGHTKKVSDALWLYYM